MNLEALVSELKRDEGVRLFPYVDTVGKTTIGVGHNLTDRGVSPAVSELMLHDDIAEAMADLNRVLPWWTELSDVRQRVMVNLCFNMGIGGLSTFKHALSMIQGGSYETAAAALLDSKWASQVGPRAIRLAEMMRTGEETQ